MASGGAAGAVMRSVDWSINSLGVPAAWPSPLRTLVALLLASRQPMFTAWGPKRIMLYNDGYAALCQDRHPRAMGARFEEVWHDIMGEVGPILDQAYAGESTQMDDICFELQREGRLQEAHFSFSYTPVRNDSGAVVGVFCACTETTAQVVAERAAAAERARMRLALQHMPGFAAILAGPEHRFEYVNDAYVDIAGRRDFIGRTVREVFPDIERQGFYELLDQVYRCGEPHLSRAMPISLERSDGERFIDLLCHPIRSDDGRVKGIFVGGYDVTAQVGAQSRLISERDRNAAVLDGMAEGFGLLDREFRILEQNAEALRFDGRPKEEIIGRSHWDVYPGSEHGEIGRLYKWAMADRVPVSLEHRHVWPDGRSSWFDMRAYPVPEGLAVFWRDVTARKETEAALAQSERAAALAESARKVAEMQKTEAIGHLTGGVAHDFNNLLAAILSYLEIARKRIVDPRTTQLVDGAIKGAERGATLTKRLLAFARRQELNAAAVRLPQLFDEMMDLLASSLGPSIAIECAIPSHLPPACVDANQLELAILNLALNARDAMPEGGVLSIMARPQRVEERNLKRLSPGDYVVVFVKDTGAGMDEATRERATEPFFTTKGVGKGTGLGLSMVQGLAQQSGGTLAINSTPGSGTEIELWLPAARGEQAEAEADSLETASSGGGTLKVLVVDDDALVLMGTAAMLEDLGHTVVEAYSGREALDRLDAGPDIDLVVTDHMMPGMTGAELAQEIARRRPGMPIVLATGYAELPNGEGKALPRLAKPFRQEELIACLMSLGLGTPLSGNLVSMQS
jgi:PAS domain S-box-containing protein